MRYKDEEIKNEARCFKHTYSIYSFLMEVNFLFVL